MKSRLIVRGVLMTAVITVALLAASSGRIRAQCIECPPPPCPPGQVCTPVPCFGDGPSQPEADCTTQAAFFTPTADTWTYVFDGNNAIKIGTEVICPTPVPGFELTVDMIRISQQDYAQLRRDPEFSDTVCNPTFAPPSTDCVFYRVHGETVPRNCYGATVDYKVFWNNPPMQGNKHDWMLLRAPCDDSTTDTEHPPCFTDPPFSEPITTFVDRKPPVGTDPVVGGSADGMSDYIVAISTAHPHKGIPSNPNP